MPIEGPNINIHSAGSPLINQAAATAIPVAENTNTPSLNQEQNQALHQDQSNGKENSRLKELNKVLKYSKLSTWMMYATTFLSALLPGNLSRNYQQDPYTGKNTLIAKLQDLFLRLRFMAHFSMHSYTGSKNTLADDIPICNLHNIPAYKVGHSAYKFHAFWSLPSWIIQNFIFKGNHPLSKIPNVLLKIFDRTMRTATSMFWNLRRITLGLLPYHNSDLITNPNSEGYKKLKEESKPIRALMSSATAIAFTAVHQTLNKYLPRQVMNLVENKLGFNIHRFLRFQERAGVVQTNDKSLGKILLELWNISMGNVKNNLDALTSLKHKSIMSGQVQDLSIEEPNTPNWYIKSKLYASVLNPFIGLGSTIANGLSIATGTIGELLKGKTNIFLNLSQNLTDAANGAMSLIYMLGEIFNHAAQFQIGQKNGEIRGKNLYIFSLGLLGMGWRMVKGAVATLAIPGALFKPLGNFCNKILSSRINNILDPFFLLFFSENRTHMFSSSVKAEESTAGHTERKAASKDTGILKTLGLIPRILMHDPKHSFANIDALNDAEALAA
jgi:hypothetical protein